MPAGFLQSPRPRGGRWGRIGQSGRGGFGSIKFKIGGFEFGIGLRGMLPSIILVSTGGSSRPRVQHPLHFLPPTIPGEILELCRLNPRVCAATVPVASTPLGLFALGIGGLTVWALQRDAARELEKKRKREAEALIRMREAEERFEIITNRMMVPELPPYYDYPALPPLVAEPVEPARAPVTLPPRPVYVPGVAPPQLPYPEVPAPLEISFPGALRLPRIEIPDALPGILAPRPVAPAEPVRLPFEFPGQFAQPGISFPIPGVAQPFRVPRIGDFVQVPDLIAPPALTPFNVPGLPSHLMSPATFSDTAADPKRAECKCEDTRTKAKKRTRCVKGLYRESRGTITYTPWVNIDCTTGKEH